ncbi:hypothetical protein [Luteolibacter soli]
MPPTTLVAFLTLLAFAPNAIAEVTQPEKLAQQSIEKLPDKDAQCLAEACRITALINEDRWEELDKLFGPSEAVIAVLKHYATLKDWQGIGAYRGFRIEPEKPREVIFRFGFAPKSNPHEIWISFIEGDPSKPRLMVLGW